MAKMKLDELLVERNLVENIDKAKRIIMAGLVFSEQVRMDKPGMSVNRDIPLHIKGKTIPYVGRGGLKLEKALSFFGISAKDKILIDIGSSTGGFTDCALQNGARLSYAIDVGYNQLDWKLRNDDRVVVMERTNFRYVTPEMLKRGTPNLATIDVSFISLKQMLPVLKHMLAPSSDVITLIKPQFEAKKEQVGSKGIVRDKSTHIEVIERMIAFAREEQYELLNMTHSPITGGEGNIEFLAHFAWKRQDIKESFHPNIEEIVEKAHQTLNK
ncbi:TlyA family RNA methyltransferase [Oceanobacillus bengalensis]|uniref:TlyA family RNA methyltransferase n=1 Tax=Oceanobacillus bengalensis TaxID=1435466 RepID=A0A494Z0K2_9BACI|nr:TlyA family RNA methyltransferase [Oceanobacillus bengalensis]RKQ16057.1 TlyA family RNA methyltransferase [Oceanobacillus bengalensis]